MKTYLTLEKSISHKSNYDGSLYKSYVTSFFSYAKSHHTNQWFLRWRRECIYSWSLFILWKKVDPDTNEIFVRAEVEFEDGLDMDFLLHKPLYFKEPAWFCDLTNEEIVQLDCIFEGYDGVLGPLIEKKYFYIYEWNSASKW